MAKSQKAMRNTYLLAKTPPLVKKPPCHKNTYLRVCKDAHLVETPDHSPIPRNPPTYCDIRLFTYPPVETPNNPPIHP
ncbi:10446_t:CDS:2 [Dentiscutata erythropus]|uniref:10446_t:CDS:1 n=1 Tax=Dentiscutata erythropus TaxID=1348616 RepID=A0A9N9BYU0_9GLOM|nr:10446_t:CDS:2 [Dentiscutata erythropus]